MRADEGGVCQIREGCVRQGRGVAGSPDFTDKDGRDELFSFTGVGRL